MSHPAPGNALLGQLDDTFYYGVTCADCGHERGLSLVALRKQFGEKLLLVRASENVKCPGCGSRKRVFTYLTPDQRVGAFVQLFNRPIT